jgi:Protein of unknown function (DUF3987)/RepB DNA-primase from phage plasmid/Primase C terminal 2 (PriCT-2)
MRNGLDHGTKPSSVGISIDQNEAARFLQALDPSVIHFTFQVFDDNYDLRQDRLAKKLHGTLQKCWNKLVDLSERGAGIFVTINETDLKGREAENIVRVRALFVDLDGASLDAILNDQEIPSPHIIIESSDGKFHVYWKVSNVPLKAFRALQKFLIDRFNGDKKVHDLPRVLRLPGFPHQKIKKGIVSPPFMSRIHSINEATPYDVEVFSALMPETSTFDGVIDDDEDEDEETPELETSAEKQNVIKEKYADVETEKVEAALNAISARCDYDEWRNALAVAYHSGVSRSAADTWSQTAMDCYNAGTFRSQWKASAQMYQIGPGTLYQYADKQKPEWRQELEEKQLQEAFAAIREATAARIKAANEAKSNPQSNPNDTPDENGAASPDPPPPPDTDDEDDEEIIGKIAWPRPVDLWGNFDPPPLPKGLLPPSIEEFAFTEGLNMGCDPAGLAMAALTVSAAATPDYIKLQVKQGSDSWLESARLWATLVGNVSSKKTPILNRAVSPLYNIEAEAYREFVKAMQRYEALSKEDQQEDMPIQRRLQIDDATIESAQQIFYDNPNGLLCVQDELSGWLGSMDRYTGNGAKDRAFWLRAYNGGPYSVDRVKRGSFRIPNLSACVLGGIQPDKIREFAADGVDDGLLQRACPIILSASTNDRDKVDDDADRAYTTIITRLTQINEPERYLNFSPQAQCIQREMSIKITSLEQSYELINKKLAAHIGKYRGIFARLCVTFHCIDNMVDRNFQTNVKLCIFEDTARRAAKFIDEFLLPHAITFYTGVLGVADNHDLLINVAGFIRAKELSKIDNRVIQRGNRSMRRMTQKDIDNVFNHLDVFGWITKVVDKNRTTFGIVNPRVHTLFSERAERERQRISEAKKVIQVAVEKRRKNA